MLFRDKNIYSNCLLWDGALYYFECFSNIFRRNALLQAKTDGILIVFFHLTTDAFFFFQFPAGSRRSGRATDTEQWPKLSGNS
jgi:hypothetical protein